MSLSTEEVGALAQELQGEYIYYNTDGQPVDYWILIELPFIGLPLSDSIK
jgi:hypothetical protein